MIAFEYQPPSERNGQTVSLHNNYYDERTGTFDHPLFSNGYFPLALISEDVSKSDEWDKFCDWLYVEQPTVQDAVRAAYTVINRFRRLPSIPELDNRTASQKDEQVAAQYNTAQRIIAALRHDDPRRYRTMLDADLDATPVLQMYWKAQLCRAYFETLKAQGLDINYRLQER